MSDFDPSDSHLPRPGSSVSGAGDEEDWVELDPARLPFPSEDSSGERKIWGWFLVLEARGIPVQTQRTGFGWRLEVPAKSLGEALEEIAAYEEENRGWPPAPVDLPLAENSFTTLSVLALLALFHNLTLLGLLERSHREWILAGGADAGEILAGQWWRTVTALTLHVDGEHLLANVLVGAVIAVRLCRETGTPVGWALILLSGAAGNYLNALLHSSAHLAVGASTAVFGAIGLLAGLRTRPTSRPLKRRWFLPLAAATALLALLGTGGENTDLGAHLFGFLAGVFLGFAGRQLPSPSEIPLFLRLAAGAFATLAPILTWIVALGARP